MTEAWDSNLGRLPTHGDKGYRESHGMRPFKHNTTSAFTRSLELGDAPPHALGPDTPHRK